MSLPRFSVKRPVMTCMVTLIVVTLGAAALQRLPIDLLPDIERPALSVRTDYEGASPDVIEQRVTRLLEEIVSTAPNVEEIRSESTHGRSEVNVRFTWGTDIDAAALDLQARIEDEINELPEGIVRPRVRKYDINSFPIVLLGISSDMDPTELTTLIEGQIRSRFARVPGVAQVDVWGGYEREVRVEVDPDQLDALGLSLDQVVRALRDANLDLPTGRIQRGRYEVTLRAPGQFRDLDQIRSTVIALRDGQTVPIGQVARVVDSFKKLERIVRIDGRPGIRVAIRKQSDANTVQTARDVQAEIAAINRDYPQAHLVSVLNQGSYIERAIDNVAQSVTYGGALAILVLALFLRSLHSTVIVGLSIPIALVATFALIYGGGMTINLMTLGGLALGVGMMVDNSIVVLENIHRKRQEEELAPAEAAEKGASEVASAVVASTLTTFAIFVPLIFVKGVTGVLFVELALVVVFALLCSLAVSLSLVPMLAARFLGQGPDARERAPTGLARHYQRWLGWALAHRWTTVAIATALLASSLLLVPLIGTDFLPPSDEGRVQVRVEMEVGTRLDLIDEKTRQVERVVADGVPEARARVSSVRDGRGEVEISLSPTLERERSNSQIASDLRERLDGKIAGAVIRTRAPQGQLLLERVLGQGSEGITVEVSGPSLERLGELSQRVAAAISDVRGISDVDPESEEGTPEERIEIDRDRAAALGLSVRDVASALEIAIAGRSVGEFRPDGESYRILVQLRDAERMELDEILAMPLSTPGGAQVALRSLVHTTRERAPQAIRRKNQQRSEAVRANVVAGDLGSVAAQVQARIDDLARPLGYDVRVAGNVEELEESFEQLVWSLVLALSLVYMVLASQYESLRDPLVVMLSVPMSAIGVLTTLWFAGSTLNMQSAIGCIMLGGIVVNNAILLVDQAGRLQRDHGWSSERAAAEAGRRRLRPILMTTATTVLGLLPLSLGWGEGADTQAPLAQAVVGGLSASTAISLLLIPTAYSLVHAERRPRRAEAPS